MMDCETTAMRLPDYEEGRLAPDEAARVRQHIESCPACAEQLAAQRRINLAFKVARPPSPGPRVRTAFRAWLDAELQAGARPSTERPTARSWWTQWNFGPVAGTLAASVIFVAGLVAGAWLLPGRTELVRDEATARELGELRTQLAAMNQAVTWNWLQQNSAGERLQTVLALNSAPTGRGAVNELLGVLAYDSNSSVRLGAVEALYQHAGDATVKTAVANALTRESSPVVQLAMIDLLAATRDPAAVSVLQNVAQNEAQGEIVRDAALVALARM